MSYSFGPNQLPQHQAMPPNERLLRFMASVNLNPTRNLFACTFNLVTNSPTNAHSPFRN